MKIFITGGGGFIGTHLSLFLLKLGHQVTAVGRSPRNHLANQDHFTYIQADTTEPGVWQQALEDTDAAVNLAGATIFKRWTARYKKQIRDSRILTTRYLVEALPHNREIVLFSTSATGYYGDRGEDILTESEPSGNDFLSGIAREWEHEALKAKEKGVRVVIARFGIVLGRDGGAMQKMIPAFRSFVGGPLGNGKQWFPWIHIEDLMSAMLFVMENNKIEGSVNFCSPHPVRNHDLAKTLGNLLKRPSFMPAPGFMIRLVLGEFGSTLLISQRAVPEKLLNHRFGFRYPALKQAIQNILGKN